MKYKIKRNYSSFKRVQAFGIGGGQVNRIWATEQAISRAKEIDGEIRRLYGGKKFWNLVLASDAFFLLEMW